MSRRTLAAVVAVVAMLGATLPAQRRGGGPVERVPRLPDPTATPRRGDPDAPVDPARGRGPLRLRDTRIKTFSYVMKDANERIDYAIFVSSKVDKKKKAPLVIALHGQGGQPDEIAHLVADAAQPGGYIVAAPMGYRPNGWYGARGATSPDEAVPNLGALSEQDVLNVLEIARETYNIDDHRIYVLGQSMGGAGALYLGMKYQQIWAAVGATAPAARAGRLSPDMLEGAIGMPMILVQGDADEAVAPEATRAWADKMRALSMTFEYDELRGAGHRDAILRGAKNVFAFFDKYTKATAAPHIHTITGTP